MAKNYLTNHHKMKKIVTFIYLVLIITPSISQILKEQDYFVKNEKRTIKVEDENKLNLRISNGSVIVKLSEGKDINIDIKKKIKVDNREDAEEAIKGFITRYEIAQEKIDVFSKHKYGFYYPDFYTDFTIEIPKGMNFNLSMKNGTVKIDSLAGDLGIDCENGDIFTGNIMGNIQVDILAGNITLGNTTGDLFIKTGGGTIKGGNVGGFVWIESAGGTVSLNNVKGKADITTIVGDISIKYADKSVKANTFGGSIKIDEVNGPIDLETGAGSIDVKGAQKYVSVKSQGGNINLYDINGVVNATTKGGNIYAEIVSNYLGTGKIELVSKSGDVTLSLPENFKASLFLTYKKGKSPLDNNEIISDFPITHSKIDRYTERGKGDINGGGIEVKVEAINGSVFVKKRINGGR